MNRIIKKIVVFVFILSTTILNAQAKKPTLMVVPSDAWCIQNGYVLEFDNQGTKVKIPDYKKAFQENTNLLLAVSKINTLMSDRGFPLKNMESVIKTLESENAENNMLTSKSGAGMSENAVDKLKRIAKADIIIQLTWTINRVGPKSSLTYNLQGLDAYTDKQVAGASGTGAQTISTELPLLLEEAVLNHMDNFTRQLQEHFDDLFKNGREIIIRIKKFDSWSNDLETEYAGKELSAILEEWMAQNTVNGRFNTTDSTESMMLFEQVRIPLYDAKGKAMDARGFAKSLQDFLKASPYSIINKLMTKGLGQAVIVLGEK